MNHDLVQGLPTWCPQGRCWVRPGARQDLIYLLVNLAEWCDSWLYNFGLNGVNVKMIILNNLVSKSNCNIVIKLA